MSELPTIEEIGGSDPDFTGKSSTEEYVAQMRGRSEPPEVAFVREMRERAERWNAILEGLTSEERRNRDIYDAAVASICDGCPLDGKCDTVYYEAVPACSYTNDWIKAWQESRHD